MLCQESARCVSEAYRTIINHMAVMGGFLAFMLPHVVSNVANRVTAINKGRFVLRDEVVRKSMVMPFNG